MQVCISVNVIETRSLQPVDGWTFHIFKVFSFSGKILEAGQECSRLQRGAGAGDVAVAPT